MDVLEQVASALESGGGIAAPVIGARTDWVSADYDDVLARVDAAARLEAPGTAPALALPAVRWALGRYAHLAQRLVDRSATEDQVAAEFQAARVVGEPDAHAASDVWSVDLVFRHLGGLERQARGMQSSDPLPREIADLARTWPLSSASFGSRVWIDSDDVVLPRCLADHPSLHRLFIDRLTAAGGPIAGAARWVDVALRADAPS